VPGGDVFGPADQSVLGEYDKAVVIRHQRAETSDITAVDAVDEADDGRHWWLGLPH
jgi:hypothetical protein